MSKPTRPDPATRRARGRLGGLLPLLSLAWLVVTLWATHTALSGVANDPALLVGAAALALPGVVAAAVPAGAAVGLAATLWWDTGTRASAPLARAAAALGAGVLIGAATTAVIIASYGNTPAIRAIAITVGGAELVGAALATPRQRLVLTASVWATLAVFLASAALNAFQTPLKTMLGAGDTVASWASAASRLSFLSALVAGLVAALVGFGALRHSARRRVPPPQGEAGRVDPTGPRWPGFLLAGAAPGLCAMVAEAITRVGGAGLLRLAGDLSEADRTTLDYVAAVRVNNALVVGFVGAIGATIAIGRTLSPPTGTGTGVTEATSGTDGAGTAVADAEVADAGAAGAEVAGAVSTEPADPTASTDPADPTDPTDSTDSTDPADPTDAAQTHRPVGSGSPTSAGATTSVSSNISAKS